MKDAIRIRNRHVAFLASFHSPEVIFEQARRGARCCRRGAELRRAMGPPGFCIARPGLSKLRKWMGTMAAATAPAQLRPLPPPAWPLPLRTPQISIIYQLPRLFVGSFTLVLPYFPTGTCGRPVLGGAPLRLRWWRPGRAGGGLHARGHAGSGQGPSAHACRHRRACGSRGRRGHGFHAGARGAGGVGGQGKFRHGQPARPGSPQACAAAVMLPAAGAAAPSSWLPFCRPLERAGPSYLHHLSFPCISMQARIISNIPLARGGPASVVIFDIHALQVRRHHRCRIRASSVPRRCSAPGPASQHPRCCANLTPPPMNK